MVRLGLCLSWVLICSFSFAGERPRPSLVLPREVVIQQEDGPVALKLTGYAKRVVLGSQVYLISSYCENQPAVDSAAELMAFNGLKQLRIRMLRKLPSSIVASMIRKSFDACDREKQLGDEIKRIEDHLRDHQFDKGDEIILTSLKATGLACRINDADPIVVEKPALVHVVWSIYVGDPPYLGDSMQHGLTRLLAQRSPETKSSDSPEGGASAQEAN